MGWRLAAWLRAPAAAAGRAAPQRALFEELEPRLLYSADNPAAWLASAALPALAAPEVMVVPSAVVATPQAALPAAAAEAATRELVFIDSRVPDAERLALELMQQRGEGRSFEIVMLSAEEDGVAQINQALAEHSELAAIHIISHGSAGAIQIGNTWLDQSSLATHGSAVARWGQSLAADGDLLLYGCDVAQGATGKAFVTAIAGLTGADVAASDNITGSAIQGGDWVLEWERGDVAAKSPFAHLLSASAEAAGWTGTLAITADAASSSGTISAQSSLTFAHTVGSGANRMLVVEVGIASAEPVTSVTYGGTSLSFLSAITDGSNKARVELWYLPAPAVGTANVVVSMGSNKSFVAGATSFSGVHQTASFGVPVTVSGAGGAPSVTVASAVGEVVLDIATRDDVDSESVGAGQAPLWIFKNGNSSGDAWAASSIEPGAASVTMSWSTVGAGGGEWAAAAVAIKPALVPGVTVTPSSGLLTTEAGGTAGFTVVLDAAPSANVTIPVSSSDVSEGTVSTALLTFTPANWATPQTVTVTGVDDALADGFQPYTVVLAAASSADGSYDGLDPADVQAATGDNDITYGLITVDTTSDVLDGNTASLAQLAANPGADGVISLREAITAANNTANGSAADKINFSISGAGPHTINVASALPNLNQALNIDGLSEPDYAGMPVLRIDGAAAGFSGISIGAAGGGSTIQGLMITGFTLDGIRVASGANNVTIADNWIGSAGNGTTGIGNAGVGNSDDGIDIAGTDALILRNVITNSGDEGITIVGSGVTNHVIQGNTIGLDPDGVGGSGNTDVGLAIISGSGNTIGGPSVAARNVISMNWEGIEINTSNNLVQGNYIGTDASGSLNRGNRLGDGVQVQGGSTNNQVGGTALGAGNLIAFNAGDGVEVVNGSGHAMLGNQIHGNTLLGINLGTAGVTANDANDVDSGANHLQNFPVLSAANVANGTITISGSLNAEASKTYRIELYANTANDNQGQRYLGTTTVTTPAGSPYTVSFTAALTASVAAGEYITATATDPSNNTSEFSAQVAVASGMGIWANNTTTPQFAPWNGSGFGSTANSQMTGEWALLRIVEAPTRDEVIAVGVDTAGVINGQIWNGSAWTAFSFNDLVDLSTTGFKGFQLAFEQQSGDALLVWDNGSTGTDSLSYRTWNGTSWSAAQNITTPVAGEAVQLGLAADPNSDSMVLVVSGTPAANDYALVWNGSSWGNTVTLDTVSGVDRTEIQVAYEAHSGQAVVVYDADGSTNAINYRTWDGTSWSAQQSLAAPAGIGASNDANFSTMASDPGSDRIALAVVTDSSEIWISVWNGSAWTSQVAATMSAAITTAPVVGLAFEHDSGDLLAAYGKSGSNNVFYRTWTTGAGWSAEATGPNIGGVPHSVLLYTDPHSNRIMLGAHDDQEDVNFVEWTGSAWNAVSGNMTSNTGTTGGFEPLGFVWYDNNRTPVIGTGSLSVAENTALAGTVVASDADGDARSYTIIGGADQALFSIDAGAGTLSFVAAPDFENPADAGADNVYDLIVHVSDGKGGTDSQSIAVTVTDVSNAPVLTTTGTTLTYTENGGATVVDSGLIVTSADSANLTGATVTISASYNSGQDVLAFTNQLGITGGWNASTGVLTLSGTASVASYQTALRSVSYLNTSEAPDTTLRTLAFDASDGALTSAAATRDLQLTAVNDAPVLDNSGSMTLPTITKLQINNGGTTVATIIASAGGDRVTDADGGGVEGIAITALASGNGSWEFSTDGGATFAAIGAVNGSSALLLRDSDFVRFVPNGVSPTTASVTFRAWDQSSGAAGTKVSVASNGGSTPFSSSTETASIVVDDVNAAPLLDNTRSPVLAASAEDAGAPVGAVGTLVSALVDFASPAGQVDNVSDVDSGAGLGIAITAANTGNGSWHYSVNNGVSWNALGAVSDGNARLLAADANTRLYFQPNANHFGSQANAITFRAWDQTSGSNGGTAAVTATHTVLDRFSTVAYNNNDGTQTWASNWIEVGDNNGAAGGGIKVNNSSELQVVAETTGYAIYRSADLGAASAATLSFAYSSGLSGSRAIEFQVSANGGASYTTLASFNATTNTGSGTKSYDIGAHMASDTRIRVMVTSGGSATEAVTFDDVQIQYTRAGGGTSAWSLAADSASLVVNAVADTPSVSNTTTNEDTQSSSGLVLTRNVADGAEVTHFKITGITNGTLYQTDGTTPITDGTFITFAEGNAGLKFTPAADFNGSGSFTVQASTSSLDAELGGGTVNATITVNAVNDAPTASNLSTAETYTEDTALNLTDIVVSDVDSASVTATLTLSSTAAGALGTGTSGSVTSSYNPATGAWTASGALADVNTLLAGLSFTPAANFSGAFTLASSVSDGVAAALTGSKAFTGVPVNDAPMASNLNAAEIYTEDTPLNLTDIVVSDVDSASATATLTLSNPGAGNLGTATSGAVSSTYNAGTGVWTASGALADVNVLLAGVSFTPALNFNASFSIATQVSDGVAAPVTGSKAFTGVAVNDAPTATNLDAAETTTEDTPLNLVDIVVSDVDSAAVTATLTLSDATAGAWSTATSGAVTSTYDSGTGVWTASGASADVNTLLAGLVFTPATDHTAAFAISTSISDGVAPAITGSKSFTVILVNDAPTASNLDAAETYIEDTPLNLTDIVVGDVDSTSTTARLTLSNPGAGSLGIGSSGAVTSSYNAGTGVWTASGLVADVNALLADLTFTPAPDFNGGFSIDTSVDDGVAAAISGSKVFTGVPVNDAPTASNLGAAETYTEDTALNLVDIVVGDVDSATVTATLTLSDAAAGALGTGTAGAVTSIYNGATGVWSASGALADVNTLLAALVFTPAPDFNGGFSIHTSVDDGVAAAITGSKGFTGTAVNDAPVATNLSAAESYTEDVVLNLADIVVSDVDGNSGSVTLTLSNPAAGLLGTATSGAVSSSYNPATGVWTASGSWVDINVLLAALSFTPTPDFNGAFSIATRISDGVAAPVTGSKLFTGVPVNDAPTATNLNAAENYTEDQPLDLTDIVVSDIDSAAVNATLTLSNPAAGVLSTGTSGAVTASYNAATGVWTASGARADVNNLLAGLGFVPAPDFNGSFTLATRVDDGVAAALLGSKSFTGVAVNDAPTAVGLNAPEIYTEDTPLNLVDLVISDIDHSTGSATLTLSDPTVGVLSTGSSGAVSASYDAGTGVWTASGALVDVNAVLAAVTFVPRADFNGAFSIATRISDGVAAPVTGSKLFTGVPVNDAPTATNLNAAENYTEDQPLDLTDIVASDIDSTTISATLRLSNAAAGSLSTGVSGAVTASFNPLSGVWSASGALADVNALLAAVVFSPAPDFNADFSIATAIDDGEALAITGVKPMVGVAVNDAPTAVGLNTAEIYTEDTALALSNLVVADIDSATLTATLTLSDATVGALSTPTSGALTALYDSSTGVWSASGAVADVNAVLAALQFMPAPNVNGSFSVATVVSDGVAAPLVGTRLFSGVAVNDAPVLAVTGSAALAEGGTLTLGAAQLMATDVDHSAAQLVYTVLTAPAHGQLLLAGTAVAGGGTFTQADLDAGRLAYRHDGSETSADLLQFSLGDGLLIGASGQLPITVSPVNDEIPRITSPAAGLTLSVPENQTAVTRVAASDADLPAQALTFAIAGGADAVHFSIDSNSGDLRFIGSPDHERPQDVGADNVYHVDLRVTDGALSSTHSVVVAVRPENDNPPQITSHGGAAQATLQVQEGHAAVFVLSASDADRPAPVLTYSVVGGADAARFAVDARTGALRFLDAPLAIDPRDADRNNVYELVVQASDGTLLVQQALRVQVRAALAAGLPGMPPSKEAPQAPAPYASAAPAAESEAPAPLVLKDLLSPPGTLDLDEAASWTGPAPAPVRRPTVLLLGERSSSRSGDGAPLAAPAQQLAAEAAAQQATGLDGPAQTGLASQDTQSLEAALGLPSTEPEMLQPRPGGLSLAALASQTATRSSTAVPGQLAPTLPGGDEGRSGDDSDSMVEALAAPVVAGGLAFSATLLVWATRAGGLVAAMMASVPAWRSLDPLPILERADQPADDADERAASTGADLSAPPPAYDDDPAAGSQPAPDAPRPGTLRVLIEPLEMQR